MDDKTPRQRLKESLQKNSEHIKTEWTEEMRSAISTARVFEVPHVRRPDEDPTKTR